MPHYFEEEPASRSAPTTVAVRLPDVHLDLVADRGVFARSALDPGTKLLLLEAPAPPARGELLDLGCGWGPIAVTLALRAPTARVWAVDVNRRALALTTDNARRAGVENLVASAPEEVPRGVRFDAIYSNPPVRIGKAALHDLLRAWLARLSSGGSAYLVVQRNLGADSLARWLAEEGLAVERLTSRMGYRLLAVTAPAGEAAP
jgi:16S rRNA (guanine1207-N2)-methyltransferase